jgi:DnaJ-class molecular chaperone
MRTNRADWPKEPIKERECSGCNGTGFMPVVQPKELGRRIFPPRCSKCEGKGRITVSSVLKAAAPG